MAHIIQEGPQTHPYLFIGLTLYKKGLKLTLIY